MQTCSSDFVQTILAVKNSLHKIIIISWTLVKIKSYVCMYAEEHNKHYKKLLFKLHFWGCMVRQQHWIVLISTLLCNGWLSSGSFLHLPSLTNLFKRACSTRLCGLCCVKQLLECYSYYSSQPPPSLYIYHIHSLLQDLAWFLWFLSLKTIFLSDVYHAIVICLLYFIIGRYFSRFGIFSIKQ